MINSTVCEGSSALTCHFAESQGSAQVTDAGTRSQTIAQNTKMDFCKEHAATGVLHAGDQITDPVQPMAAIPVFSRRPARGGKCPAFVPSLLKPFPVFTTPAGGAASVPCNS